MAEFLGAMSIVVSLAAAALLVGVAVAVRRNRRRVNEAIDSWNRVIGEYQGTVDQWCQHIEETAQAAVAMVESVERKAKPYNQDADDEP